MGSALLWTIKTPTYVHRMHADSADGLLT